MDDLGSFRKLFRDCDGGLLRSAGNVHSLGEDMLYIIHPSSTLAELTQYIPAPADRNSEL